MRNISFQVYTKSKDAGPQGGVAILARRDSGPIPVRLDTSLQAVAVSVKLHKRITVCSIYVPPGYNEDFEERELEALLDQLPKPYMLLGDFNAHNSLWFDRRLNRSERELRRGKRIENVLINKINIYYGTKLIQCHSAQTACKCETFQLHFLKPRISS